jgi:hypothetical protein
MARIDDSAGQPPRTSGGPTQCAHMRNLNISSIDTI